MAARRIAATIGLSEMDRYQGHRVLGQERAHGQKEPTMRHMESSAPEQRSPGTRHPRPDGGWNRPVVDADAAWGKPDSGWYRPDAGWRLPVLDADAGWRLP